MAEDAKLAYKRQKELFVSGLTGGSVWEINLLCCIAPAAVFFWSVLQSRYRFFEHPSLNSYFVDFLLNVVAILAATTTYSNSLPLLHGLILAPAIFLYISKPSSRQSFGKSPSSTKATIASGKPRAPAKTGNGITSEFPVRPYLTAYRGGMMIVTALCILAVDFRVFPRRFAKVETWGTSLMDVGVGSFVFSSGLVAAKSSVRTRLATVDGRSKRPSVTARLTSALRASLPLLILGLVRLYSVKGLDYAEHVSEYGVHWNFFFTLGSLPIGMALIGPIIDRLSPRFPAHLALGLLIALLHGTALDYDATGLRAWALTAPRVNLLSQNREGIISMSGYLVIFLLGLETGGLLLPAKPEVGLGSLLFGTRIAQQSARSIRRKTLLALAAGACVYGALTWVLVAPWWKGRTALVSPISRRLANPPYVLWIAAFNHLQLFLYAAVENLVFPSVTVASDMPAEDEKRETERATSEVLAAYNSGGLLLFLLANLGTGLVNMTLNTLTADSLRAVLVLLVYMTSCTTAAVILTKAGIKLKF